MCKETGNSLSDYVGSNLLAFLICALDGLETERLDKHTASCLKVISSYQEIPFHCF